MKPDTGTVTVNGLNVKKKPREVRKQVGFIFSDPDRQIIMPTVLEDIELSLTRTVADKKERRTRALAALDDFGLAGHADQPRTPSPVVRKQLLALASIMVIGPSILVADEPTTMLDLRNTLMLHHALDDLDEQLIVLTHHLELLTGYDRVLVLDEGRIVADDEPGVAIDFYRSLMRG